MPLGQNLAHAVSSQTTFVDAMIALVLQLESEKVMPPDVAAAVLARVNDSRPELNGAILQNMKPVVPADELAKQSKVEQQIQGLLGEPAFTPAELAKLHAEVVRRHDPVLVAPLPPVAPLHAVAPLLPTVSHAGTATAAETDAQKAVREASYVHQPADNLAQIAARDRARATSSSLPANFSSLS